MNSYQTIISELIRQKQILDEKGFAVNVANYNPSPNEITTALEKINFDFSAANATEADVAAGKTFYAQDNQLKVGTFSLDAISELENVIRALVAGDVGIPCIFPEYCTKIRPYAFYLESVKSGLSLFEQDDLIIPDRITQIGSFAFFRCQVKNKVIVPGNCYVYGSAFQYSTMTEVDFAGWFTSSASYVFSYCPNLTKVNVLAPCMVVPGYAFANNAKLKEVYLNDNMSGISDYAFNSCKSFELIKFANENPPTLARNAFYGNSKLRILVPYLKYNNYYNATNYLYHGQPIIGYGNFTEGDTLPAMVDDQSVAWYATIEDAVAGTNAITICPTTGELYLKYPPTTT